MRISNSSTAHFPHRISHNPHGRRAARPAPDNGGSPNSNGLAIFEGLSRTVRASGGQPSQDSAGADKTLAPTPSDSTDSTQLTGDLSVDAISLVSDGLRKRGFDPASFGFSYSEQPVSYPGGSYTNHLITATIGGRTENYDAALVAKSPDVAVVEMLHLRA